MKKSKDTFHGVSIEIEDQQITSGGKQDDDHEHQEQQLAHEERKGVLPEEDKQPAIKPAKKVGKHED